MLGYGLKDKGNPGTEYGKEKDRALFLQADKAVPYGIVVDVMGRIKAAGIEKLGVVAMPSTEGAAAQSGAKASR